MGAASTSRKPVPRYAAAMADPAAQPSERRAATRIPVRFPVALTRSGALFRPGAPDVAAEALNLSATGMLVRMGDELTLWSRLTAALPAAGPRDVRVVRRDGDAYGCLFQAPLDPGELDAVLASDEAQAGLAALRAEAEAPPPPPKRGLLRLWRR